MKTIFLNFLLLLMVMNASAQYKIEVDDQFPEIPITNFINTHQKLVFPGHAKDKFYILNFWATWCAPCIPHMEDLAKLQERNGNAIQIIAISGEKTERIQNYYKKNPSKLWLANDTTNLLYHLFNIRGVSQSAIINPQGKVIAIVATESINQEMITKLTKGENIVSNANFREQKINNNLDIFSVDSTLTESYTIRKYIAGQQSMTILYGNPAYKGRRISFVNTSLLGLYKAAYQISSSELVVYEGDLKEIANYKDKSSLYSLDLLVKPEEKDSLLSILKWRLPQISAIKSRIEYRKTPVYVLINKGANLKESINKSEQSLFSGNGYNGENVKINEFKNYLANELGLPVVDETNLVGRYDIKTNVEMRTDEEVLKSIRDIGFDVVKTEREMPFLILSK